MKQQFYDDIRSEQEDKELKKKMGGMKVRFQGHVASSGVSSTTMPVPAQSMVSHQAHPQAPPEDHHQVPSEVHLQGPVRHYPQAYGPSSASSSRSRSVESSFEQANEYIKDMLELKEEELEKEKDANLMSEQKIVELNDLLAEAENEVERLAYRLQWLEEEFGSVWDKDAEEY